MNKPPSLVLKSQSCKYKLGNLLLKRFLKEIQIMSGIVGNFDGRKPQNIAWKDPLKVAKKERKKERVLRSRSPILWSGAHLALFLSERNGAHLALSEKRAPLRAPLKRAALTQALTKAYLIYEWFQGTSFFVTKMLPNSLWASKLFEQ